MKLVETQFSARLRLGDVGDVIGELEAAVATYAYQEAPVGAADHRAVPSGSPGRRAGGVPAGPDPAGGRARARSGTATAAARAAGPEPGPGTPRPRSRGRREPAVDVGRARRARDGDRRTVRPARAARGSSRSSGRAGSGRRPSRSRPVRALSGSPGGIWLARLETATTADDVLDTLIAAMNVTGGEAALLERLKGNAAVVILDNCEHVIDAAAALAVRLLDAAPGLRILCTSQVPLDVDGEAVFELTPLALSDAVELFTRRGGRPARQRSRRRGARTLPFARRPAAGDRARRGANQDLVDRGDHPPPRRSLQRVERPDEPQTATPPRAEGDDRVELRAVVPRRQAGTVGACHVRRRRTAPRGRVRARSARCADVDGDRRGRTTRKPLTRDRRRRRRVDAGPVPAARQHPRVRARGDDGERADRAGPRRARRMVRRCSRILHGRCAQQSPGRASLVRPGRARQHRRRAGLERHARPAARARHRQRVRLGLDRARRQQRRAADPRGAGCRRRRGPDPGPGRRAAARGVDRGVDGSPRARPRARRRSHRAC